MRPRLLLGAVAVGAAALATCPTRAVAQSIPSSFRYIESRQEVGPFSGYVDLGQGRFGFGPKGGLTAGARWSVNLSGPLAFETAAGIIRGKRDVIDPGRLEGDRAIGEADVLLGSADARLVFTFTGDRSWHGVAPYIFAGGGMIFDLGGSEEADLPLLPEDRVELGSGFLGTFGTGTRVYLTERTALRADAMFTLSKLDTPTGFGDPDRGFDAVQQSEWVRGLHFTLALVYRY